MIKNVIFDIGNVLTVFGWQDFLKSSGYDEETLEKVAQASVKDRAWSEWDRGVLSDEEVIDLFVKNAPSLEQEIRHIFSDVHGMVSRLDYAIPWIQELKAAGYHCYYLSNFAHQAHFDCMDALDFLPCMDGGILSYQDKVIKPDADIYELLLARYDLKPEECVFLDDTEKNLPPAAKLGMKTILFRDKEQAVRELEALGVKA